MLKCRGHAGEGQSQGMLADSSTKAVAISVQEVATCLNRFENLAQLFCDCGGVGNVLFNLLSRMAQVLKAPRQRFSVLTDRST